MRIYKIFFRSIAMVIMVMILSDCRQSYYIARNTGRNIMTLSDHQRAKSALNANDLNAAQGYLTGEKYNNRYRPVSGEESWGSLQYRAAKIVANAAANGQKVRDDALYLAYISLFEAEEIWNRGDAFLTNIGKQQFIHDAIDYSQFPVIACTARRKGWHLTLPADYREQNFRGGGRFDWASCRAVE